MRCRGRKTPPTEHRIGRGSGVLPVGAALAATGRLRAAGFDHRRNREQARSHILRHGTARGSCLETDHCCRRGLQPAPRAARRRCRGRKTPPTGPRLRQPLERDHCGSGLGRDGAVAGRRLRSPPQSRASSLPHASAQDCAMDLCGQQPLLPMGPETGAARCPPPLSGSEDPSHRTPAPATTGARPLWERPWPRRGCCGPQAPVQGEVEVRRPLQQGGH